MTKVVEGHRGAALAVAAISAIGVVTLWWMFVARRTGRLLDDAALHGAEFGRNRLWQVAEPVLDVISTPFVAVVLVVTMLLAVLRRRVLFAVQVAVLMAGANLTTQLLKRVIFDRPDVGLQDMVSNTLPSGHTTAAASCAAALVFVAPAALRPVAAVVGALYTAATGVSTLIGGWHRPSDVVAAVLVVLAWGGLASALGAGRVVVPGRERPRETLAVVVALVLAALAAGIGAALALQASLAAVPGGLDTQTELVTAYGGGALGVVAATSGAFAVLLVMRRAADPHTH